jgi:sirohydrochlorin ferrochelatase
MPGRRKPHPGRRPTGGHPDLVEWEGQLAKAEFHEGRQDSAAAVLVREDPGNDRVVLEG